MRVHIDNQSTIKITKNPVYYSRAKHISIRFHWLRDAAHKKDFLINYVQSQDNLADLLTKSLGKIKFVALRNKIMS